MKLLWLFFIALLFGCASVRSSNAAGDGRAYELRNGRWFSGSEFVNGTWYVAGGVLHSARPQRVDSVIDLAGAYVVPPYAEGHNHWLEPRGVDAYVQTYLRDGVFYLKDQSNALVVRIHLDSVLNRPTSVDFISANQGFTGPGGHPLQIATQFLAFGSYPQSWTEADIPGNVVNVVETPADIERVWPGFMRGHPDFVKVFLLYSEEYERRHNDPAFVYKRGLNPALVQLIVRRAHAADLRVSAHVYTGTDFHNAVVAGVDDIAHMPGTGYDSTMSYDAFRIRPEDAQLLASRGGTVTTTLQWLGEYDSTARRNIVERIVRPNIELLRKHQVTIVIGSDEFRASSAHEADVLSTIGVFSNAELIDMWTRKTPASIFPRRRIGRFADGYEASLLVLTADPLQNFSNSHRITMRMKQGHILAEPRKVEFPALQPPS